MELQQQSIIQKGLTRQELVVELFEPITAMLKARYDFDDIAAFLNEQGVSITAGTLKSYYKKAKRQRESQNSRPQLIPLPSMEKRSPQSDPQLNSEGDIVKRFPESASNHIVKEFNL